MHVALAQERTLCGSSQGVNLRFNTVWHAFDLLGCRLRWWAPTGALPIECSECNAISMLPLCVHGCFMQSSEPLSLLFFFVHFSILQTRKKQDGPLLSHCANFNNGRSSRTCTYMQGRQLSSILAVRRRTATCGAQHFVSIDGDKSVPLNASRNIFACCFDRYAISEKLRRLTSAV